jgi:hypothetical protein
MRLLPVRRAFAAPLLTLLALTACDLPSEAPIFQQTWVVPTDTVTVGVEELLPAGLTVTGATTPAFSISVPDALISTTFGAMCGEPACQSPVTVTAPVPAFTSPAGALSETLTFPSGMLSATITGGTLRIAVTNGLGFDPLRPNGAGSAPYGSLEITITSGTLSSTQSIIGSPTSGMPSGETTIYSLPLPTGVYTGTIALDAQIDVPAGDAAPMQRDQVLGIVAGLQNPTVSEATVAVIAQAIATPASDFDLEDVDIGDDVVAGGLLLEVVNPFTATATLDLEFSAPAQNGDAAVSIQKTVNVAASSTTNGTINLTQTELRSLLGKTGVSISTTGTVNGTGAGNGVTVLPTSEITIRTQLSLTINVGA